MSHAPPRICPIEPAGHGEACSKLRDGTKTHTLAVTMECKVQIIN